MADRRVAKDCLLSYRSNRFCSVSFRLGKTVPVLKPCAETL
jgi:hypothetical protein